MINTIEPQTAAGTGPLRPSRYWYLVAGGLLVAAVARLTAAVIGMFSWDRSATDQRKVNKLLDRGDAGVNRGSNLISQAVADGSLDRAAGLTVTWSPG